MKRSNLMAIIFMATTLTACGTPSDGYYDKNGNYVPYNRYNREAHDHSPLPGGTHEYDEPNAPVTTTVTTYTTYDRRGYYDYNGHYVSKASDLNVPGNLFPPRGMCRVWFTNRIPEEQPAIESCDGIRTRVPAGAYVIYGG